MNAQRRIPVLIALGDFASGVVSWGFRLRDAFAVHPRYEILLVNCRVTGNNIGRFDVAAPSDAAVRAVCADRAPAVVVPNFVWDIFPIAAELAETGAELRTIGFCRADSEEEYYAPLAWFDPVIAQFVAVSPECGRRLGERLPHRAGDITVLPTGVWVPERLERVWSARPIRLVYGGRIVQQQKRVMDFVPLAEKLLERRVDFVFDIIGAGRQLAELRTALEQVPHGGRVRLLDRVPPEAMPRVWAEHDIFIQTSDFEGTSNSMLESMACGTVPVITRTESGVAGVIEENANGMLVPIGEMDVMADVIAALAQQPERIAVMGRAAHETARLYSMESYVARFSEVLDRALAMPGPRRPADRPLEPSRPFEGIGLFREDTAQTLAPAGVPCREEDRHLAHATEPRPGISSPAAPADAKRLLIAFPSPVRGGAEDYTLTIARAARARGWEVTAGFPYRHTTDSLVRDFRSLGAHYHPLEICELGNKRGQAKPRKRITRTLRYLRRFKPGAVLLELPGAQFGFGPLLACAVTKTPVVAVYQLVRDDIVYGPLRRSLYRMLLRRRLRCVAVSEHNRDLLCRLFGVGASGIHVVPNGVNLDRFKHAEAERAKARQRVREELGFPAETRLLLTVGRLAGQKGYDVLIPAVAHIAATFPDVRFIWAGDGPWEKRLREMAAAYRVEEYVRFLGVRGDIPDLLAACDLFVHPSRHEGQPFSLLESMAAGLPIVATRASGIPEIIEHERHGLLCAVDDIASLRDAVIDALRRPGAMQEMAAAARERVQAFTEAAMIEMTFALIEEARERQS
ncbi:MAG: glycosyltransferase family 4 protein [Candidatus Hydrogenedentes bacterium]|nr:glycosyltransferase family 4 protein [Candidatus Hydrogenedentota bacterium]